MLRKVVSGGQTGSDIAGLRIAKAFGLEVGGWIPKGFKAEDRNHPEYALDYNLVETETEDYVERTLLNARDSDGTIRIASNLMSIGEKCTLKGIKMFKKPHFDVNPRELHPVHPQEIADWIIEDNIEVLNVAGNRESVCRGIEHYAEEFLACVFEILRQKSMLAMRLIDEV